MTQNLQRFWNNPHTKHQISLIFQGLWGKYCDSCQDYNVAEQVQPLVCSLFPKEHSIWIRQQFFWAKYCNDITNLELYSEVLNINIKPQCSQKRLNPRFCGLYHWVP